MATLSPAELEARILVEREGLLVVDKPADLPTSGRSLEDPDCLQWLLLERARRIAPPGFVWAVHQLDADTSGVNLFTPVRDMVARLKDELAAPSAVKSYLAVVHGEPPWDTHTSTAPLGELRPGILGVAPEGRAAHSEFRVLARNAGHALVEARIRTGRTHQIRIHLAHAGHPLVGEGWYRAPPCALHPRQALHAARMSLPSLDVEAPLAPDLIELLARLGLPK